VGRARLGRPACHTPRQNRHAERRAERAHEGLVGVGLHAAQAVVDVREHELDADLTGQRVHAVDEDGRVDAARGGDQHAPAPAFERHELGAERPEQRLARLQLAALSSALASPSRIRVPSSLSTQTSQ
jgi:hypothetical protein